VGDSILGVAVLLIVVDRVVYWLTGKSILKLLKTRRRKVN
jgi:hypothetical protein